MFRQFPQKSGYLFPQFGDVVGDGIPEYVVVNGEVSVNEGVPVSGNHFPGDVGMVVPVGFGDVFSCFTDDFEGPGEGIFAGKVLLVVFVGYGGEIVGDEGGFLIDVPEESVNADFVGFHAASAPTVQMMASCSMTGRRMGLSHFLLTRSIFLPKRCSRWSWRPERLVRVALPGWKV